MRSPASQEAGFFVGIDTILGIFRDRHDESALCVASASTCSPPGIPNN